jgi:hypothetical protein
MIPLSAEQPTPATSDPDRPAPWLDGDVEATAARLRIDWDAGGNVYARAFGMVEGLTAEQAVRVIATVSQALDQVTHTPRGGDPS